MVESVVQIQGGVTQTRLLLLSFVKLPVLWPGPLIYALLVDVPGTYVRSPLFPLFAFAPFLSLSLSGSGGKGGPWRGGIPERWRGPSRERNELDQRRRRALFSNLSSLLCAREKAPRPWNTPGRRFLLANLSPPSSSRWSFVRQEMYCICENGNHREFFLRMEYLYEPRFQYSRVYKM